MPELPAGERTGDFREVELGFTPQQMQNETSRCLECGCSAYFDCELRKYANDFGIDITPFIGEVRKYKVDPSHPFIILDPNKCIACGRCVRTCSDILKVSALGFVNRGFTSIVRPSMEKGLLQTSCISCGNCITACPTGAIAEHLPFAKPGPWRGAKAESVCHMCSLGCRLNYRVFERDLFAVESTGNDSHNQGYLCLKGRFGYRYMLDPERLLSPKVRKKGILQEVSWETAFAAAAKKLKSILERFGPESIALFGSPRMTNEELYLLQRWERTGFRSNRIGSFSNLLRGTDPSGLDDMIGITASTATLDDLKTADLVLVINSDLTEDHLIAEINVKDAVRKGGRLITVSSSETALTKFSDLWIDAKRGAGGALIAGLSHLLIQKGAINRDYIDKRTEGFEAFLRSVEKLDLESLSMITGVAKKKLQRLVDWLAQPQLNLIILYGPDSLREKAKQDLRAIGSLLLMQGRIGKPGNGLILLHDYANSQGLLDMGVDPHYLPGLVSVHDRSGIARLEKLWKSDLEPVFNLTDLKMAMEKEKIKAMIVFGEDPLSVPANRRYFSGVKFLLVCDHFLTQTAARADVVLPASLPIESSGSMASCDRRLQKTVPLFPPKSGMENWKIIKALAGKMQMPLPFHSVDEIFNEIMKANPHYQGISSGEFWGADLLRGKFPTSSGKANFGPVEIEISPCDREKQTLLASEAYYQTKIKGKVAP